MSQLNKLSLIILFIVILSCNVIAIGITPGRSTINLLEQKQYNIDFKILNNEHKDMKVVLYTEGELSKLIKLKDEEAIIKSSDKEFLSSYSIDLTNKLTAPGSHSVKIIAMAVNTGNDDGTTIGINTAVATQLLVRVPYPDKYLETDFYMIGENIDQDIRLIVPLINLGSQKIENVKASIDIFDINNNKISSIDTDSKSLNLMEKKELVGNWMSNVKPGKYYAIIKVNYDGKTSELKKDFELGYIFLDLLGVSVKDFKLGSIAKFNILLENKVNYELDNVYAEMDILNNVGDSVSQIKSPVIALLPNSKSSLYPYWDTDGVSAGQYESNLKIHSQDKLLERRLKMNVKDSAIDIDVVGTGYVVKSGSASSTSLIKPSALIIILIIILIIGNIVWFMRSRKRNQEQSQPPL